MRCGRHSLVALAPALADGQGQQQAEQGPAFGTVGRRDLAAATVGKARGYGKAQACDPARLTVGGEEGLEDMLFSIK